MNEKLDTAMPEELEEAPTLRLEDLRNADLKEKDLTKVKGLLPEHLAGADLTGATLPDDIAKFPALGQVAAISGEARKIFIGLLAACVYSWLVIGTTTDLALILNTASSPLPIINTPIPIAGFYVVGAALLAAVYCYFHFYLQRLWRTLATLPAIFPDGTALDDRTDPWLLTNLVRADFKRLWQSAPPLTRLENLLTILLAWWLVPLTLLALWARYLPAHYWLGTTWLVALIGITALFGRHSYRLARATLRGEAPAAEAERDEGRGVSRRAWHELRQIRPDRLTVGLTVVVALCSLSAFRVNPQGDIAWHATELLSFVGIRTYADLREVEVAQRPDGWDGKNWDKVKPVDLRGRNLAFADTASAFLTNSDLRGAQLQGTYLLRAQLQGAALTEAQLQDAALTEAQLQGTDLRWAQLQGAYLFRTQLQGADLRGAQLQGAVLKGAQLQGTDLRHTALWRASVGEAQWDYGDLRRAHVQPVSDSDIDALVTEVTKGFSNEERRKAVAKRLNAALRTAEHPARPDFPEEWRSEPNVMFDRNDPRPEPFHWGRPTWATEEAYDQDLATSLSDWWCKASRSGGSGAPCGLTACGRSLPAARSVFRSAPSCCAGPIPSRFGSGSACC